MIIVIDLYRTHIVMDFKWENKYNQVKVMRQYV